MRVLRSGIVRFLKIGRPLKVFIFGKTIIQNQKYVFIRKVFCFYHLVFTSLAPDADASSSVLLTLLGKTLDHPHYIADISRKKAL